MKGVYITTREWWSSRPLIYIILWTGRSSKFF